MTLLAPSSSCFAGSNSTFCRSSFPPDSTCPALSLVESDGLSEESDSTDIDPNTMDIGRAGMKFK